ncbi:DUF2269 family protein [Plantibacter flavus]|uniref:DUF2269 family protein n=1 Tax=Plantibacter flavus TaxID=150123 RepID=UPI003F13983F
METVFSILHVVGAVFIVGPMAILPMSAMRAVRAGNSAQVATLATSTAIFSYLTLAVIVLGFGLVGLADPKYELSVTTPWVLTSIILSVAAVVLSLVLVVPAMKRAANGATGGSARISAGSGIVAILLVVVTVLMVWKP